MNDYSCINNDRSSLFFNSELMMSDTEFSDSEDVSSTLTKGNRRHVIYKINKINYDKKFFSVLKKKNAAIIIS